MKSRRLYLLSVRSKSLKTMQVYVVIQHSINTLRPNVKWLPFCWRHFQSHFAERNSMDFIMSITMTPTWAWWCLKSPVSRMFTLLCIQGADQRKYQSSASLAFVRGIHRRPVNSQHKWPLTPKMFPFDDVIMCRCLSVAMPPESNVLITKLGTAAYRESI